QVYPAVEYDFIPQDLKVEQGTLLHFQWTGSDANNNNNAGNGRAGTDRSNLVQVQSRSETVPLPLSKHTLLFNALANPDDPEGRRLADKFAYLDQDSIVTCDPDTNQNSETNCKQLNGAAYFDGLVEMKNNDFSNRSHKAQITVTRFSFEIYENIALGVGGFRFLVLFIYVCCAIHACRRPGSWLFSRRYRPRVLRWVLRKATMERLLEERRQLVAKQRKEWANKANAHAVEELNLSLKSVKLLPRDVIGLTFELPQGFAYQAGQYILLGWKGEWHPFTLTSAPEENCISVHIRAPNTLDWCSALRKRLTETAPGQAAGLKETKPPKAPRVFEYSKHTLPNSHIVYNVPKVSPAEAEGETGADPRLLGRNASGKVLEPARSGMTMISRPAPGMLPEEAVVLQVTGPFGAPAQKVWGFDTLMVVGAGIGVTPFASILRSVQLRARQRETIMSAATRPSAWRNMVKNEAEDSRASLQKLVEDLVVIPKKIYFYWICRGQEEFDWFCDLLADAAEGPHAGIVDITLFLTGEIELSQVKKLPCASGQFFGRPNWGRIFKQNREKHQGEHVGVFLCGSPIIGEELSRQSVKHSDLVGTPHATRFSFFKEHF
ncbi:unnamed protein product, partial [Effrenium voratum]